MKVLAGDWREGCEAKIMFKQIVFQNSLLGESVFLNQIEQFDIITENNHASIPAKLGWGAAGAVVLGPIGLLAGVLGGGNKRERIMSIKFKDGRKVLLRGDAKDAEKLAAATF